MASDRTQDLFTMGPFAGIDTISAGAYVAGGHATSGQSANPYRVPSALVAERGRTQVANITIGGVGSSVQSIGPYIPATNDEWIMGTTFLASTYSRFVLQQSTGTQTLLNFGVSTDATFFDQVVQYGNVVYDNAGHQYSNANATNTYLWHYPAPNGVTYGYAVTPTGSGSLGAGTYYYAFTQTVSAPNSGFSQETSPTGANISPYPYIATISGTGNVTVSGTFAGTNPDGSTFVTNIYRQSSNQPVWYLVATVSSGSSYTDTSVDSTIAGNVQLTLQRDPPPVSPTNLGAIFNHKERIWNWLIVNDTDTNNLPQSQLWYSNIGRPWEFDAVNQVILVGNSATPSNISSYTGQYSDYPVGGISLSSVALLFKSRTTWVVYGDDQTDFVVRKLFDIGCRARHSIVSAPLDSGIVCFFLSEHGVVMTDGQSFGYVSEKIRSVIEGLSDSDRTAAVGFYWDHAYYLSFPTLGQTYAYYTSTQEWLGPLPYASSSGFSILSQPTLFRGTNAQGEVIALRPNTNYIDRWFSEIDLDLGAPQTVSWVGPLTPCGAPTREKYCAFVSLCAPIQPGVTAFLTLTLDPGVTPAKQYSWSFDLSLGPTQVKTVPTDLRGFLVQLTLSFSTLVGNANAPVQIFSAGVHGNMDRNLVAHDN